MKPSYSRAVYTSSGLVQPVSVPFPYIERSHVHVYAVDPDTRKLTTEYPILEWTTPSTIRPQNVPTRGQKYAVVRVTPRDLPLVDYADSAVIEAADLDMGVIQNLYICEEILDELEWQGNEISLLWTAYNQLRSFYEMLRADHDALDTRETNHYNTLVTALNDLRTYLECELEKAVAKCRTYAVNAQDSAYVAGINAADMRAWLNRWYTGFLPAIQKFLYISIYEGNCLFDADEYEIIDGNVSDFNCVYIADGKSHTESEWYSWSETALKLMHAYDEAEDAHKLITESLDAISDFRDDLEDFLTIKEQVTAMYTIFMQGLPGQVLVRTATGWVWRDLEDVLVDPTET